MHKYLVFFHCKKKRDNHKVRIVSSRPEKILQAGDNNGDLKKKKKPPIHKTEYNRLDRILKGKIKTPTGGGEYYRLDSPSIGRSTFYRPQSPLQDRELPTVHKATSRK